MRNVLLLLLLILRFSIVITVASSLSKMKLAFNDLSSPDYCIGTLYLYTSWMLCSVIVTPFLYAFCSGYLEIHDAKTNSNAAAIAT